MRFESGNFLICALRVFSGDFHSLRHPHIVPLHGYYETATHVHLVLAYAPSSDLLKYQTHHRTFRHGDDTVRKILVQLCQALQYLEICQVAHRDLKPENILVVSNHKTKLDGFLPFAASSQLDGKMWKTLRSRTSTFRRQHNPHNNLIT